MENKNYSQRTLKQQSAYQCLHSSGNDGEMFELLTGFKPYNNTKL